MWLVWIMFAPLILVIARAVIYWITARVNNCPDGNGALNSCVVNGVDLSEQVYIFTLSIGLVFLPFTILWMVVVGVIMFIYNITDGRKNN